MRRVWASSRECDDVGISQLEDQRYGSRLMTRRDGDKLQEEIEEFYKNFRVSNDLIELRNLVLTAELIVRSALARQESRGLHFSRDYPGMLPEPRDTILQP